MLTTERHYKITLSDGSTYYGRTTQSGNNRYSRHQSHLKAGTHKNKHIQEVYNKYGYDDWVHEWLVEETGDLDHHNNIEFGYIQSDPKSINVRVGSWVLDKKKYDRQLQAARRAAWTPEELEEHKRKTNQKWLNLTLEEQKEYRRKEREYYHKRKQKNEVI